MDNRESDLYKVAEALGFHSRDRRPDELVHWLREEKQIHVEVSGIWDDFTNTVESYCYTITAPIFIYYVEPVYASGGTSYKEMLFEGLMHALVLSKNYEKQKHLSVSDDQVVIAYLKGYGDKGKASLQPPYKTNLEKYAYLQGKQGDYIEEGLTEDDILLLVRNKRASEETLKLE